MRPSTLAEVANLAANGGSFDICLANFLDDFYAKPSESALAPAPVLLAPQFGDLGHIQDAYLAAVAEDLAQRFDLRLPDWTFGEERVLHRPGSPPRLLRCEPS